MSIKIRDAAMIALAAGGIVALAATAEFGIPAIVLGAGMSAISGALAVNGSGNPAPKRERIRAIERARKQAEHQSAA